MGLHTLASEEFVATTTAAQGPKKHLARKRSVGHFFGDEEEMKEATSKSRPEHNLVSAFLCCFLSVTGGVSLGGILFPSDADHPNTVFQVTGMQIGLLAACVSSWAAYFRSQVYCGVAGGMFPPVVALSASYFQS